MPITTTSPARPSLVQRFRSLTEAYLLYVAQKEMVRRYPGAGTPPAPKRGYGLLAVFFLPGFKLTPWAIKKRLLSALFRRPAQHWPDKPWENR